MLDFVFQNVEAGAPLGSLNQTRPALRPSDPTSVANRGTNITEQHSRGQAVREGPISHQRLTCLKVIV